LRSTFEVVVVNVFDDEWEQGFDRDGYVSRLRPLRKALGAERMGASVFELAPGEQSTPYHFQYAEEEWLLVLEGDPSLRTPEGVQTLKRGDIVAFRRGPEGAHQIRNETSSPARVLMISTIEAVEVAVFPDSGKTFARADRLGSAEGARLMNREEANLDYFDGEQ
jgi:uncharacterized cupin superfamily protein